MSTGHSDSKQREGNLLLLSHKLRHKMEGHWPLVKCIDSDQSRSLAVGKLRYDLVPLKIHQFSIRSFVLAYMRRFYLRGRNFPEGVGDRHWTEGWGSPGSSLFRMGREEGFCNAGLSSAQMWWDFSRHGLPGGKWLDIIWGLPPLPTPSTSVVNNASIRGGGYKNCGFKKT